MSCKETEWRQQSPQRGDADTTDHLAIAADLGGFGGEIGALLTDYKLVLKQPIPLQVSAAA